MTRFADVYVTSTSQQARLGMNTAHKRHADGYPQVVVLGQIMLAGVEPQTATIVLGRVLAVIRES